MKIKSIKKISSNSKRYDIQTKKTNNFFANNILVHNSLIKLYHYKDNWHVATNGTIDASDAFSNDEKTTFKDLFFDVISKEDFKKLSKNLNTAFTYLFELVHPSSRVIVNYGDKKELVLVGVRINETGKDFDLFHPIFQEIIKEQIFGFSQIRLPKIYKMDNIRDISELLSVADKMNTDGTDFEGFVVAEVQDGFVIGRVKIKSPKYLKFHRLTGGRGVRTNIIQLLIDGEQSEFESYLQQLPDYIKTDYVELKEKYNKFVEKLNRLSTQYTQFAIDKDRKTIALYIQENVERHLQPFVFAHLFKNVSVIDYIQSLGAKKIKDMLLSQM